MRESSHFSVWIEGFDDAVAAGLAGDVERLAASEPPLMVLRRVAPLRWAEAA